TGGTFNAPVQLDSTIDGLDVSVSYSGAPGAVTVELVAPSGAIYAPTSCLQAAGETLCNFKLGPELMETGEWDLSVVPTAAGVTLQYTVTGLPGLEGSAVVAAASLTGET